MLNYFTSIHAFKILLVYNALLVVALLYFTFNEFKGPSLYKVNKRLYTPIESLPEGEKPRHFITINFYEAGVGNLMFQYAALYGIAKKNNMSSIIRDDSKILQYFNLSVSVYHEKTTDYNFLVIYQLGVACFDDRIKHLPLYNISLHGYWQSWKYFNEYKNQIRSQFKFGDDIINKAQEKIKTLVNRSNSIQEINQYISIHVRRGDVLDPINVEHGFKNIDDKYLSKAMTYFRKKYPGSVFIVCSNDYEWCEKNIRGEDIYLMKNNIAIVDLAILSQCNHSIMTIGTFGWWGAYLSGGEVIYYKSWQKKNSYFANNTKNEDYFLPEWIGIV